MAYKLLGFAVWRGGRWYLRRQLPGLRRKAAIAAISAAVVAAVVVAGRQASGQAAGQ